MTQQPNAHAHAIEQDQDLWIRPMRIEDYDEVYDLWCHIQGFCLRSVDDSREYIERFLRRNPDTSCVALIGGKIVGSILCGHDGRQGAFYHVCVNSDYRHHGIGKKMVKFCLAALAREGISKCTLVAFGNNHVANKFWNSIGWTPREDINPYEFRLNEENIMRFVQ